jgi:hypothetical protein
MTDTPVQSFTTRGDDTIYYSGQYYNEVITCKGYRALVTYDIPIYDIDNPSWWTNAKKRFCELLGLQFAEFDTYKGKRLILLNKRIRPNSFLGVFLLTFLCDDTSYVCYCFEQDTYRARISGKSWRDGLGLKESTVPNLKDITVGAMKVLLKHQEAIKNFNFCEIK